jgi:hypothetical protein
MGHLARACRNRRGAPPPQKRVERRRGHSNKIEGFNKEDTKVVRSPRKSYAEAVKQRSQPNLKKINRPRAKEQNQGLEWRRELPILEPGDPVFIQHPHSKRWDGEGIVIGFGQNAREYVVEFNRNQKRYVRNRIFLKPNLRKKKVEVDESGKVVWRHCWPKEENAPKLQKPVEKPTHSIRRSSQEGPSKI